MGKFKKQKGIFKRPPTTKAEMEGMMAYKQSLNLLPHQRLQFVKAVSGVDVSEGDLTYAQSLGKKAQGAFTQLDNDRVMKAKTDALASLDKAKLRYGKEKITAEKAVAFVKGANMRKFTKTMLLAMIVDHLIVFASEEGYFSEEQYEEIQAFFHATVELDVIRREDDMQDILKRLPSNVDVNEASDEIVDELFELSDSCIKAYNEGDIAEKATGHLDEWHRRRVMHLMLGRIIIGLLRMMTPDGLTQEQFEEASNLVSSLTLRYIDYESIKTAALAS